MLVNVIARKFVSLENAYRQPYLSSDENIFSAHNLSAETFIILPFQVFSKMMALPLNPTPSISFENDRFRWYIVPLLHTCENGNSTNSHSKIQIPMEIQILSESFLSYLWS